MFISLTTQTQMAVRSGFNLTKSQLAFRDCVTDSTPTMSMLPPSPRRSSLVYTKASPPSSSTTWYEHPLLPRNQEQLLNRKFQAAETAAYMTVTHPDYAILAARIAVSNLHKQTKKQFSSVIDDLFHYVNPKNHKPAPMIAANIHKIVMQHAEELNSAIVYDRDFNYQYFGFKTLERSYLLRLDGKVAERPQHMIMRVAVGIHGEDIEKAIETYNLMSQKCFTHASPTLFNAGTPQPQLASCFLIDIKEDSIEGIYDTLKTCALISKTAGGIGLNIHRIRATGSYISGTNGSSNGIVPMLRVFNNTARYVDQGGNKRPGAFAMYLEPWHADVFEFLDLRKNHGKEEVRARDLFFALWIPDLFMKRVEKNGEWTLMCPNEAPGLADVYGDEFEALYEK